VRTPDPRLFDRRTEVFRRRALRSGDSFFAGSGHESHPGRRYIGICAQEYATKSTMIRVYVAVLAAAQTVHKKYATTRDRPVHDAGRLLHSLRDLGGMRHSLRTTSPPGWSGSTNAVCPGVYDLRLDELTSRLSSKRSQIFSRLEYTFPKAKKLTPIDVLCHQYDRGRVDVSRSVSWL